MPQLRPDKSSGRSTTSRPYKAPWGGIESQEHDALLLMGATSSALLVFDVLRIRANRSSECLYGVRKLAGFTRLKPRTVKAALAWLVDRGAVALGPPHGVAGSRGWVQPRRALRLEEWNRRNDNDVVEDAPFDPESVAPIDPLSPSGSVVPNDALNGSSVSPNARHLDTDLRQYLDGARGLSPERGTPPVVSRVPPASPLGNLSPERPTDRGSARDPNGSAPAPPDARWTTPGVGKIPLRVYSRAVLDAAALLQDDGDYPYESRHDRPLLARYDDQGVPVSEEVRSWLLRPGRKDRDFPRASLEGWLKRALAYMSKKQAPGHPRRAG